MDRLPTHGWLMPVRRREILAACSTGYFDSETLLATRRTRFDVARPNWVSGPLVGAITAIAIADAASTHLRAAHPTWRR